MDVKKILKQIGIAAYPMIAVYALNIFLDVGLDAYKYIPWLDSPLHIIGGTATAWSIDRYWKRYTRAVIKTSSKYIDWFLVLSTVAIIALGWEIYEYIMKHIWPSIIQVTVFDTLKDMVLGLIGAFFYLYKVDFVLPKIKPKVKLKKIIKK